MPKELKGLIDGKEVTITIPDRRVKTQYGYPRKNCKVDKCKECKQMKYIYGLSELCEKCYRKSIGLMQLVVKPDTHKRVWELKKKLELSSINATIKYLMNHYEKDNKKV